MRCGSAKFHEPFVWVAISIAIFTANLSVSKAQEPAGSRVQPDALADALGRVPTGDREGRNR